MSSTNIQYRRKWLSMSKEFILKKWFFVPEMIDRFNRQNLVGVSHFRLLFYPSTTCLRFILKVTRPVNIVCRALGRRGVKYGRACASKSSITKFRRGLKYVSISFCDDRKDLMFSVIDIIQSLAIKQNHNIFVRNMTWTNFAVNSITEICHENSWGKSFFFLNFILTTMLFRQK